MKGVLSHSNNPLYDILKILHAVWYALAINAL